MMNEYQINRQNEKNRNIPTDNLWPKQHIGRYLRENIKPNWNFLINGSGNNRTSTLFQRILQLYQDDMVREQPLIIISCNNKLLNRIEQIIYNKEIKTVRPFAKIDADNPCYKPFAGMNAYEIEETFAIITKSDHTLNFEQWNNLLFHSVCKVLDKYDYELSINNLQKIFKAKRQDIIQMLRREGFLNETEQTSENSFNAIGTIIDNIYQKFAFISSYCDGRSLVEQVRLRKNLNDSMPCYCFNISDGIRKEFLNYLSQELRMISEISKPIIVVDSVPLAGSEDGEDDYFFKYLYSAVNISLNLSGESCDALIPNRNFEAFIKAKCFRMCFTKGGASGENLSKIEMGSYEHIFVKENRGEVVATFHLISHDKHYDMGTDIDNRLRIRGDDLRELSDKEAYFVYGSNAHLVSGLDFTKNIIWR